MSIEALPVRLSEGTHAVDFLPRQEDAHAELSGAIDRRFVHVRFTETRGGTELGFEIDEARSDLTKADWDDRVGTLHLEGELTLDGVPVRCVVDLDIATMEGTGHLDLL